MKQDPQPLEYERPPEPSAREVKHRRARRSLVRFVGLVAVGTLLQMVAARRLESLAGLASLVIMVGSVGVAWWASVLFDLGGSGHEQ